jgi:hypothetical protein
MLMLVLGHCSCAHIAAGLKHVGLPCSKPWFTMDNMQLGIMDDPNPASVMSVDQSWDLQVETGTALEKFKANMMKEFEELCIAHGGPAQYLGATYADKGAKAEFAAQLLKMFPLADTVPYHLNNELPMILESNKSGAAAQVACLWPLCEGKVLI